MQLSFVCLLSIHCTFSLLYWFLIILFSPEQQQTFSCLIDRVIISLFLTCSPSFDNQIIVCLHSFVSLSRHHHSFLKTHTPFQSTDTTTPTTWQVAPVPLFTCDFNYNSLQLHYAHTSKGIVGEQFSYLLIRQHNSHNGTSLHTTEKSLTHTPPSTC